MGIRRGHRAKPLEWVAEKAIFLVSLTAILLICIGRKGDRQVYY